MEGKSRARRKDLDGRYSYNALIKCPTPHSDFIINLWRHIYDTENVIDDR